MRRIEVRWAELPPPVGPRPVVILTRDAILRSIDSIVVALSREKVNDLNRTIKLSFDIP